MSDSTQKARDFHHMVVRGILVIVATLLMGAVGISYIRLKSPEWFKAQPVINPEAAANWLRSIENNDSKKAIFYASILTGELKPKLPKIDYLKLLYWNDLNSIILTTGFNKLDFIRWRDAWELRGIALRATEKSSDEIRSIADLLNRKVSHKSSEKFTWPELSLMKIWKRGYATGSNRLRIMLELAKQLGYNAKIIAILNEKGQHIHYFAEFRKGERIDVIDLRYQRYWPNITFKKLSSVSGGSQPFEKLSAGLAEAPAVWPKNFLDPNLRHIYLQCSELADYRRANQVLEECLASLKLPGIPSFGKDPQGRIEEYIRIADGSIQPASFNYWQLPIVAVRSYPNAPKIWFFWDKKEDKSNN